MTGRLKTSERLGIALNLRPGEGGVVSLLLVHSLFQGIALAFFAYAAKLLFLNSANIEKLPYVYVIAGVSALLIAVIYTRVEHRVHLGRLLQMAVVGLFLSILIFRILLEFVDPAWVAFALFVWYYVMHYLIDSRFWELSAVLFDLRQSKRLFGLVSLGESIGMVIGYLLAGSLGYAAGVHNLLLFSAGSLVISLVLLRRTLTRTHDRLAAITHGHGEGDHHIEHTPSMRQRLRDNRYVLLLTGFTLFSFATFVLIDYGFLSQVKLKYHDDRDLAFYLGLFLGIASALNIVTKAFLSGRIIGRYGIRTGLVLLPALLLVVTLVIIAGSPILRGFNIPLLLFALTFVLSDALRSSLTNNSFLILFQPLTPNRRLEAHTIAKALGEPISLLAGGVLLVMVTANGSSTGEYATYTLLLLFVGWIVMGLLLERGYLDIVRDSLKRHVLRGNSLSLDDATTTRILEGKVESNYPSEVIYALHLLMQSDHPSVEEYLLQLASHESSEIRLEALRRVEELKLSLAREVLRERIRHEHDPMIRGYTIRVYCSVSDPIDIGEIAALLNDPDIQARTGAMVGALRNGGIEGVIIAGEKLMAMVASQEPIDREAAARVIGDVGNPNFYHPLQTLLHDTVPAVQEAALVASGKVGNPALMQSVAEALAVPQLSDAASTALIDAGKKAMPHLEALSEAAATDVMTLRRICRVCGRIGGAEAVRLLHRKIDQHEVRDQALASLAHCGYSSALADEAAELLRRIHREAADATWNLMSIGAIEAHGEGSAIARRTVTALEQENEWIRRRVLLLLSFIYDRKAILRARDHLESKGRGERANALEILDLVLPKELARQILPLFEEEGVQQQASRLNVHYPHPRLDLEEYLRSIIVGQERRHMRWTRACALQLAGELRLARLASAIVPLAADPTPIIAEAASQAVAEIRQEIYQRPLLLFAEDPEKLIDDLDTHLVVQPSTAMLSTVEKVITLKSVNMFSETPEEMLVDVASILKDLHVEAGSTIIRKGEIGTCMYIIHEGRVRVHDGDHTLGELGGRDIVGELSLLDPEPRSASVTAMEDTFLLRLDQDALYEIMADSIDVARGIMRVLCGRLRRLNERVTQMGGEGYR